MKVEFQFTTISGDRAGFTKLVELIVGSVLRKCQFVKVDRVVFTANIEKTISEIADDETLLLREERFKYCSHTHTGAKTLPKVSGQKAHYDIVVQSPLVQDIKLVCSILLHEALHIFAADIYIQNKGLDQFEKKIHRNGTEEELSYDLWEYYEEYWVHRKANELSQGPHLPQEPNSLADALDRLIDALRRGRELSKQGNQEEANKQVTWSLKEFGSLFLIAIADAGEEDSEVIKRLFKRSEIEAIFGNEWQRLRRVLEQIYQTNIRDISQRELQEIADVHEQIRQRLNFFSLYEVY